MERAGSPSDPALDFALDCSISRTRFRRLAAQGGQRGLAAGGAGWAQKERASISGWYRLNARGHERADHCDGQNRDLCYQLRTQLHCRAPLGPGEFLPGSTVASAFIESTSDAKTAYPGLSILQI